MSITHDIGLRQGLQIVESTERVARLVSDLLTANGVVRVYCW